jgi:hypothetical protein
MSDPKRRTDGDWAADLVRAVNESASAYESLDRVKSLLRQYGEQVRGEDRAILRTLQNSLHAKKSPDAKGVGLARAALQSREHPE